MLSLSITLAHADKILSSSSPSTYKIYGDSCVRSTSLLSTSLNAFMILSVESMATGLPDMIECISTLRMNSSECVAIKNCLSLSIK